MKYLMPLLFYITCSLHLNAQAQYDTVYLCLKYLNINRNGPMLTGTHTSLERIFFVVNGRNAIYLGQPDNYFQDFKYRFIRLLLPKDQPVVAGIQIIIRPEAINQKRRRQFDTLFTVTPMQLTPPVLVFTHVNSSASKSFEFTFIKEHTRPYTRAQKKLNPKRIIAQYNFLTNEVQFLQPAAKLFVRH
jgi:hypothetical protein